jgi:galactokinase
MQKWEASVPGRICLFGEHLDYLGLPVIAAAISLRIQVKGQQRNDSQIIIHLPNIKSEERLVLPYSHYSYEKPRDYFRSSINVAMYAGLRLSKGIEAWVNGSIPINSGTSSSSALIAAWLGFLTQVADNQVDWNEEKIAELAYQAEVLEFGEPGGMMDHYSTAVGNIIYLESQPQIKLEKINTSLGTFVLGDSGEPKDTIGILKRVKQGMLSIVDKLNKIDQKFSLLTIQNSQLPDYQGHLNNEEYTLLAGTISNRDILHQAKALLNSPDFEPSKLGELLNSHQKNLREAQKISTPKIDRMIQESLEAGALGGKINGSGGGGCMFAYAPQRADKVAQAIKKAGGKAYIVEIDRGLEIKSS